MTREKMTKFKWLEENGFSDDGITYIVMGKSYGIKDDLKECGFKFSPLLRWHGKSNDYVLPLDCFYHTLNYNDIFTWDEENGVSFLRAGARDFLENLFNPPRESKSDYQGIIGEKIILSNAEVVQVGGYAGAYGYTWVYTFKDQNENEYTWFTSTNKCLSTGMKCQVSGTVKDFNEYKGVKTTVLTRCKIGVLN